MSTRSSLGTQAKDKHFDTVINYHISKTNNQGQFQVWGGGLGRQFLGSPPHQLTNVLLFLPAHSSLALLTSLSTIHNIARIKGFFFWENMVEGGSGTSLPSP